MSEKTLPENDNEATIIDEVLLENMRNNDEYINQSIGLNDSIQNQSAYFGGILG